MDLLGFEGVTRTELVLLPCGMLKRLLLRFEGPLVGVCSMFGGRNGIGSLGS